MISSQGRRGPRQASAMSDRSFIATNRGAEERRERLVVGRVVTLDLAARFTGGLQRIEHRIYRLVGIGNLALTLHGVEILHVGAVGLFIVAEHAHRTSRLGIYSTTFGTRKK